LNTRIAELAVSGTTTSFAAEQGIVTGSLPLTPFSTGSLNRLFLTHHWNQAVMLEVHQPLSATIEQIVQQLLAHHDALRLRFVPDATGWQAYAAPDKVHLSCRFVSAIKERTSGNRRDSSLIANQLKFIRRTTGAVACRWVENSQIDC